MSDHAADDTVPEVDESRRKFLIAATAGTGAVGAVLTAVPFVASWSPSESARAAGLPTEIDLSQDRTGPDGHFLLAQAADLRRQVARRRCWPRWPRTTASSRIRSPRSPSSRTTPRTQQRALKPECWCSSAPARTWAACRRRASRRAMPSVMANWPGGFFCPCHGSKFDLAGRVFEGSPASVNLRIPPY